MTPSLEGWPTKAKEAPSSQAPLDTNPGVAPYKEFPKDTKDLNPLIFDYINWSNTVN